MIISDILTCTSQCLELTMKMHSRPTTWTGDGVSIVGDPQKMARKQVRLSHTSSPFVVAEVPTTATRRL